MLKIVFSKKSFFQEELSAAKLKEVIFVESQTKKFLMNDGFDQKPTSKGLSIWLLYNIEYQIFGGRLEHIH